jgi:hypothetical protein
MDWYSRRRGHGKQTAMLLGRMTPSGIKVFFVFFVRTLSGRVGLAQSSFDGILCALYSTHRQEEAL